MLLKTLQATLRPSWSPQDATSKRQGHWGAAPWCHNKARGSVCTIGHVRSLARRLLFTGSGAPVLTPLLAAKDIQARWFSRLLPTTATAAVDTVSYRYNGSFYCQLMQQRQLVLSVIATAAVGTVSYRYNGSCYCQLSLQRQLDRQLSQQRQLVLSVITTAAVGTVSYRNSGSWCCQLMQQRQLVM